MPKGIFWWCLPTAVITDSHQHAAKVLSLDMALLKKFIMIARASRPHLADGISVFFLFFFLSPDRREGEEKGAEVVEIWTVKKKRGSVTFKRRLGPFPRCLILKHVGHVHFMVFIDFLFFFCTLSQICWKTSIEMTNLTQIAPSWRDATAGFVNAGRILMLLHLED